MNKHGILFLICIICLTALTCTYFDPFSAAGVSSLFWEDFNKQIFRMPAYDHGELRDFPLEPQPPGFWSMTSMVMDPVMGRMYMGIMADNESGIYRSNYDVTDTEWIIPTTMPIEGMAIDFYTRELYWSEASIIKKATLKNPDNQNHVYDAHIYITDLEIDMVSQRLFYVDNSNIVFFISTNGELLGQITLSVTNAAAKKIELSLFDNKIFWFNDNDQKIYHSNVTDASGGVILSPTSLPGIIDFCLDLERGHMYWADINGIFRIPTDNALSVEQIVYRVDIMSFTGDFMNARQY